MIMSEILKARREFIAMPSEYVMNHTAKMWRKVCMDGLAIAPAQWTTKCGWRFGLSKFIKSVDPPSGDGKKCDQCWDVDNETSSTSDSSESED